MSGRVGLGQGNTRAQAGCWQAQRSHSCAHSWVTVHGARKKPSGITLSVLEQKPPSAFLPTGASFRILQHKGSNKKYINSEATGEKAGRFSFVSISVTNTG